MEATSMPVDEQVSKSSSLHVWQLLGLVLLTLLGPGGPIVGPLFGIGAVIYDFVTREQPGHRRALRVMMVATLVVIAFVVLTVNVGTGHSSKLN